MEPITIGLISIAALFVLILIGFHVGVALMISSYLGVWAIVGRSSVAASVLKTTAFSAVGDYIFAVIPLFVLMGLLTTHAGATRDLFDAAGTLLRRIRGGLGVATVAANAVFAAITGVSVASAAVFSKLAVPEMERRGYARRFSLGIVASSSILGMLIPPSILLIIYGVISEQSVGHLFAAGIGPGLLIAFALALAIWAQATLRPAHAGGAQGDAKAQPPAERLGLVVRPWPLYLLIVLVLGGIYGGWFTPTEAGAMGALGALCIVIGRRAFAWRGMLDLLLDTGKATAGIFFLLIAASMYGRMLTLSRLPDAVTNWALGLDVSPVTIVFILILVLLLLGMILDSVSILLLTVPIMAPVMEALGYDLVWFGLIAIVAIEIGLLTPPFGMIVFTMKASLPADVTLEDIYIGSAPFLIVLLAALGLMIVFPPIVMFLPNLIY